MKFSVLISLYYKENPDFLRQSLDSVFTQTLPPDEVVLVEDGPLTAELDAVVNEYVRRYQSLHIVKLPKNMGLGNALNEGLKHCSNELVARMDTDDICYANRFEKQVAYMKTHPEIAVCGAWIDEFQGDRNNVTSTRKLPETSEEIFEFGKKRNPINHPVVMFRKSAVEAVGSYQPFYLFEDYFLWVRMLQNGAKFHNLQEPLLYFRFSPDMFNRRGGWKYACVEARFYLTLYRLGYIGLAKTCMNLCIRFTTRIVPNKLRGWIYKKILR